MIAVISSCCDLLENSYLCGISNNRQLLTSSITLVVICLKIRTFVVSATTLLNPLPVPPRLWFAWKFVPLWYQQQLHTPGTHSRSRCDLLENSYLCGISNNNRGDKESGSMLWFAWKFVPLWYQQQPQTKYITISFSCDLLENSYLCGISNNFETIGRLPVLVVICLKIRTFVVSATTSFSALPLLNRLWFAWKFVPLWYQQQPLIRLPTPAFVVICLKIRTFVVSATTFVSPCILYNVLWFAWKFVPLWYQQQR